MRHRLERHNPVGLGFFPLIEAFDLGVEANRKVRRLHIRPGQILVAVLRDGLGVRSCNPTNALIRPPYGTAT